MKDIIDHGFLVRYRESENRNWQIDWGKTWSNDIYFHDIQEKNVVKIKDHENGRKRSHVLGNMFPSTLGGWTPIRVTLLA